MTKRQLQKGWQEIREEIIHNKPKIKTPYPPKVVCMRELLQCAGLALEKVEADDKPVFYQRLYEKIMSEYHRQKTCLKI